MEQELFKQSRFSRTLMNEGKMGAYYTDTQHCRRIGRLLEFPEEFIALEPSIGDGSAIAATLEGAAVFPKVYGVELNQHTYEEIKKDDRFYVIGADFLNGIKVSNKSFSYVFSNPPYGVDADRKERLEKLFMEKFFNYMIPGGILCYVIPYPVFMDEKFLKPFFSRFNPLAVFRFDDAEYAKFHQICVIAQRRNVVGFLRKWYEEFLPKVDELEKLAYLPKETDPIERKIPVPESSDEKLVYFTTLAFDAKAAGEKLRGGNLYSMIGRKGFVPEYRATELGRPAVPLKKDLLYLCAISGGGQGLTGSKENHDLHLQRGVAKVLTDNRVVTAPDGKKELVESSYTKITLNVIENDGTISTLE